MKKLTVFSGNRAEYGLLSPILKELQKNKNIKLFFIVSGSHLDKNFGKTINEIRKEDLKIYKLIHLSKKSSKLNLVDYTPKNISEIIYKYSDCLKKIKPDLNMVYADRFETFGAAIASTQMNIPTIHIEGGDKTEGGTLDDNVRHSITKLSHIHITTNEYAKKRIIKMGEEKWRVKNFGYSNMDHVYNKNYASKKEIENKLNLKIFKDKPIILFTQHPIPLEKNKLDYIFRKIYYTLKKISEKNVQIIVTYPNSDYGGKVILKKLKTLKNKKNIKIISSLGRYYYQGILALNNKVTKVICAGNSSSGIKETAYFKCPVLNIGPRQDGRLRSENVLNASYSIKDLIKKLNKCVFDKKFFKVCLKSKNYYGGGNTSKKISKFVENLNVKNDKLLIKKITY